MAASARVHAAALFTLSTLFWGGNIIAGRLAGGLIPPFTLSLFRWLIALAVLLPFAWGALWRERSAYMHHWRYVLLLALTNVAAYNTLIYWGLNHTGAINAAVLNSAFPMAVFALTWACGQERAGRRQLAGMAVAVGGVMVVAVRGEWSAFGALAGSVNRGDLAILAALCSFAVYSVLVKRAATQFRPVGLLCAQMILGCLLLLPLSLYERRHGGTLSWRPEMVWLFVYVGLFPSVIAHLCWLRGVTMGGANLSGLMYNLIPVFAIALAVPVLGESLRWFHALGIALILGGIYLALWPRRAPRGGA